MKELEEKLNNVLGYLTAMVFDKPELAEALEHPLNELSEATELVNNFVLDLVSDRFSKNDAQNIINAWDWIPDGDHTLETAQVWVSQKLKPVIEEIRYKLNDH